MLKKNILSLAIGLILAVGGSLLLAFCVPENVPILIGFDEKIVAKASKWIMLILCLLPLVLAIFQTIFSKKHNTFIFKFLIAILSYINMLVFIYLCLEENQNVGDIFTMPISLLTFLPLSFSVMVAGMKLKNVPYKSRFGIKMKYTLKSEFIWKQTHYIVRDIFLFAGFALCFASIIFAFFHFTWIEIPIFVCVIIICLLKIRWYAKSMFDKLEEMEKRKENLEKKNS